ncbi:MAG: hypothetical protein P9L90_02330 [Candidatus Aadella gelida]|nr:hypothetical protein [Candidatus Aadella gelida]
MALDKIEKLNNSIIQHGKENNRIYLMSLDERDLPLIIDNLNSLAEAKGYTKIFAKVPAGRLNKFLKNGYIREAAISGFYNKKKAVSFLLNIFQMPEKKKRICRRLPKL